MERGTTYGTTDGPRGDNLWQPYLVWETYFGGTIGGMTAHMFTHIKYYTILANILFFFTLSELHRFATTTRKSNSSLA